ncbi:MAG: hypothetical protein ACK56I_00990, partial [bacterium]
MDGLCQLRPRDVQSNRPDATVHRLRRNADVPDGHRDPAADVRRGERRRHLPGAAIPRTGFGGGLFQGKPNRRSVGEAGRSRRSLSGLGEIAEAIRLLALESDSPRQRARLERKRPRRHLRPAAAEPRPTRPAAR